MSQKKESLIKLLKLIEEISIQPDNYWFRDSLYQKALSKNSNSHSSPKLEEIYEFCLRKIISEHAEKFYADFKLLEIKEKLIEDFIRMEKSRREDNFEDFCLAAFQQLELIISTITISTEFGNYLIENKDLPAILYYDRSTGNYIRKGRQTIGKLIFFTSDQTKINNQIGTQVQSWHFNLKYRAVLYYYYFNKEVRTNTYFFDRVYDLGNFLYQGRNLNHRGAAQSKHQQNIIDDLIPNQHKYYFKFLGFLEDFITTINKNL